MKILAKSSVLIIILSLVLWSCKKDEVVVVEEIKEASDVHKFIYDAMATWYLWVDNVPALTNSKFENKDSLNVFLNQKKYTDPENLFLDLLYQYKTIDKWSFIVDDYAEIDNWVQGISQSMGFEFGLAYLNQTDERVVGYVQYVLKGSPAAKAGMKRGDLFLTIDGQQLTASNYSDLLFSKLNYTMGLATYTGSSLVLSGKSFTMTAVDLQENPILLDTILNVSGLKVGYLVYNGFNGSYDKTISSSYDIELNKVFLKFKNAGINKLILDLRYNGGGAITSTIYLASMIYSTDTKKVFSRLQHNNLVQAYLKQEYGDTYFNDYFTGKIDKTDDMPETPINSLGLTDLYVITTSRTASASELLINGLKPYLNLKQVGSSTTGKYVGSYTLKDYDNNGNLNASHKYALQPITLKIANSLGVSDFKNGLEPSISASEDIVRLKPFGSQDEEMLKACINDIKGTKSAVAFSGTRYRELGTLKGNSPFSQLMYYDSDKIRNLTGNSLKSAR